MDRESVKKILPILQAIEKGKTIQAKNIIGMWEDTKNISLRKLQRNPENYRIKPEPREFEIRFNKKNGCLIRIEEITSMGNKLIPLAFHTFDEIEEIKVREVIE